MSGHGPDPADSSTIQADCVIAGGGPAGVMLGVLLARAGVRVAVLEKHGDFFRDFRGDTIHPSTLQLLHELGWLDDFLKLPHQETRQVSLSIGAQTITVGDFSHLPTAAKFLAFIPQWDFLDFLADKGRQYPGFRLLMGAEVTGLLEEDDRVAGVRATIDGRPIDVRGHLTVGADGRHSTVRSAAGLKVVDIGAPIDVFWFRLSRLSTDPGQLLGRFSRGAVVVLIDRGDYWQCGFVIAKGGAEDWKRLGLDEFRREIARVVPFLSDRVDELKSWDDIRLLTVAVDRLSTWHRPGLLCIGDAAHAMSPVGGVGINLAIQDAVATANRLWKPLRDGSVSDADLAAVQARREWPTKATQKLQVLVQERILGRVLGASTELRVPWFLRLFGRFPVLRRLPARIIGMGFRPEHIQSPSID